jgi:parallel beta-helix repeat protein
MAARRFAPHHPLVAAVALALGLGSAHAATITVTSGGDAGSGSTCTLRQAIEAANTNAVVGTCTSGAAGTDTIQFNATLANSTITLGGSQLSVTEELAIVGSGQTLDANGASRVLYTDANVTASTLTFTGGNSSGDGGGIYVYNGAALTLSDCVITGNSAASDGGGIYLYDGATLAMSRCTVSGNDAGNYGGAIYGWTDNTITIANSTISGNTAADAGGGIYIFSGELYLTNSTLTNNEATASYGNGGGIYAVNQSFAAINNTTITGNQAGNAGGGIYLDGTSGIDVNNTILSANMATIDVDLARGSGGGGPKRGANKVSGAASPQGTTVTISASLLGAAMAGDFTGNGNIFNNAPGLGSLANNGGPTQTLSLQAGSPAIDAGNNALIPPGVNFDQRGTGFPRVLGSAVDMGAFELAAAVAAPPALIPAGSPWSLTLLGGLLGLLGIIGLRSIRS